jgi:hypothetical protein
MTRSCLGFASILALTSAACATAPIDDARSTSAATSEEAARPIRFFDVAQGSLGVDEAATFTFEGRRGWTVEVIAATPNQELALYAPHLTVTDAATGAVLSDQDDALPVQGRSGHAVVLPSDGTYVVRVAPTAPGRTQAVFTLEVEAAVACTTTANCPAMLTCQGASGSSTGRCWPADLGPQRCDASGHGEGCVPVGRTECEAADLGNSCQVNSFLCGRVGGQEVAKGCFGSSRGGVCCHQGS